MAKPICTCSECGKRMKPQTQALAPGGPTETIWHCTTPKCRGGERMWPDDDTPMPPKSAYALRHPR